LHRVSAVNRCIPMEYFLKHFRIGDENLFTYYGSSQESVHRIG
jgi:hypothetical protein